MRLFRATPAITSVERPDTAVTTEDWLWLLGSLAQLLDVRFDPVLVHREVPPPHSMLTLDAAATRLGMRLGRLELGRRGLAGMSFPFVAALRPDAADRPDGAATPSLSSSPGEAANATLRPVIVVRIDGGRVAFIRGGSATAEAVETAAFLAMIEPVVLLAGRAPDDAPAVGPAEERDVAARAFGFAWFVPEIIRHHRIWTEIIVASLLIQLAGLAVPLFTQIVIDKVLVHRTHATLWAVATGLVMFCAFSVGMSWVRQYLVTHTGTRLDAVLGGRVFAHLLKLPVAWFEARPTGTVITRLHGVETIREFLCGSAVALLLDIPFVLVFLAVMFWYSWQLSLIVVAVPRADRRRERRGVARAAPAHRSPVPPRGAQPGLRDRARGRHRHREDAAGRAAGDAALRAVLRRAAGRRLCHPQPCEQLRRAGRGAGAGADRRGARCRRAPRDGCAGLHHRHAGRVPDVRLEAHAAP